MWLIVLRSLAVYGGSTAGFLFLAHRFVLSIRCRAALLLAAAPLLFTGRAMLSGGVYAPLDIAYQGAPLLARRAEAGISRTHNPLAVDVVSQMFPWRQAVREAMESGRLPLWNRYILNGEPLLGVAQPAVFHPGAWIGLLLPLPQAWTFDMSLRLFLAALSAYLFFRGTGHGESAAALGAAAWTFSDLLVFYVGYPVTPSVAAFPLLLLGLHRLIERGDRGAVGLTVAALVLTTVSGHPETLLFCVAGAGVFFLFELRAAGSGRRLRPVLLSLLAGALALGLCAVVLLPFLEILPQTWQHVLRQMFYAKADRSDPLPESLRRLLLNLLPYAYGALGQSQVVDRFAVPVGYAGSLLFPFASAGAFAPGRRKWPWLVLGAIGLGLSARLFGITDLVAALPVFDIAILDYFVFLAVFAAAALAVQGLERLQAGEGRRVFVAASVACVAAVVLAAIYRQPALRVLGMSPSFLRQRVLLQVLPLLLALGVLRLAGERRRLAPALVAALLVLFVAQRGLEERDVYPTYPARAFYPRLPVLDVIPRSEPVRVAGLRWMLAPNMAALYGLEDVRGYEAMVFGPLAETFGLWCQQQPLYYNRVDDPASPFLAFLGARYVIASPIVALPPGWTVLAEEPGTRVFENPKALPRAFAPRRLVWTDLPGLHLKIMSRIGDYANDGVVGEARPGGLRWWDNGPARVRVASYEAGGIAWEIDADGESLIGTSIPAWHGWKLTIDGKRAPLLPFNHAFLAFLVPPGHHAVAMRYMPDGFLLGAAISLSTLLLCAILVRRPRARHT